MVSRVLPTPAIYPARYGSQDRSRAVKQPWERTRSTTTYVAKNTEMVLLTQLSSFDLSVDLNLSSKLLISDGIAEAVCV